MNKYMYEQTQYHTINSFLHNILKYTDFLAKERNWVQKGKNVGQLWLAYTELQGDFTGYTSTYLLTLDTLPGQNSAQGGPIYTK